MARVTVEDCIEVLPNTFELVLLGAQRARQLSAGEPPNVVTEGEKSTVIALREIAAGRVDPERLRENLIRGLQRIQPEEEVPEEDELDRMILELGGFADPGVSDEETGHPDHRTSDPETDDERSEEEYLEDRRGSSRGTHGE
jgi:DNA-directed RNA polymerase subunit omega